MNVDHIPHFIHEDINKYESIKEFSTQDCKDTHSKVATNFSSEGT